MHTTEAPADRRTAIRRPPDGERPVITEFIVAGGDCWDTGGTSAEKLGIWGENRPEAEQSSGGDHQVTAGWVYNIVQGQQNRPANHRSRNPPKIRRSPVESSSIGTWP